MSDSDSFPGNGGGAQVQPSAYESDKDNLVLSKEWEKVWVVTSRVLQKLFQYFPKQTGGSQSAKRTHLGKSWMRMFLSNIYFCRMYF